MNDDFIKHLKNEKWRIVAEKKASIKKADAASSWLYCILFLHQTTTFTVARILYRRPSYVPRRNSAMRIFPPLP